MAKLQKTLFISDLHLEEKCPDIARRFLRFLTNCDASVNAIYILGDLFEVWIGDDDDTPFHRDIIHALRMTTERGIPIYFLYGNRDFLIGKKFLQATGCRLIADEEKINLYGTPILLMHGDTLCTQDVVYLQARKRGRNRFLQRLFLLLTLKMRKNIANNMRAKSTRHIQSTVPHIMDVTQEAVEKVMQKHDVYYLIHGHTHRPFIHSFLLNNTPAHRIVLGAWHERGNVLIWDETGEKKWIEF